MGQVNPLKRHPEGSKQLESLGVVTGQRQTLRLRFESVDAVLNRSAPTLVTYTVRAR